MNLFFRLFWLTLVSGRRSPVAALGPCRTPFRVMPSDLDVLRHMNNGIYFSVMDLARVDLMKRAGLASRLAKKGWYPVIAAENIQIRRSLKLFDRFDVITRVITWDDKAFLLEQAFERRGEVVAYALVRSRFLRREGGTLSPAEVLALADIPSEPVPQPESDVVARWHLDQVTWMGDGMELRA